MEFKKRTHVMKSSLNFEEIQEKETIRASVDLDRLSLVRNKIK